jgi:hypothetical protein
MNCPRRHDATFHDLSRRPARNVASWRHGTLALLLLLAGRAAAQVDPSGDWRTLHTAHFRVHFRPTSRAVAQREAREAERAYALLSRELHPPRGAIDLVLGDDIDAANGFTTVFPSSRITVLAAPPATDPGLDNFDDWLRLVTTHELTHVFHLDRTKGLWRVVQGVFGRLPGSFPNEYQPSWVVEGLAVYYESRLTGGGRVKGSFHTQLLAADAAARRTRSPWNALYFTRWSDGYAPYAYGSRFFEHLSESAGDTAIPRFIERTSGQLIPYRVGRQVRRASGRDLETEWRTGPAAGRAGVGETGEAGTVLAARLWTEPVPRVSPDGRRVAILWDDGKSAPEIRELDGEGWRVLRRHRVNRGVRYDWQGDTLVVAQLDFTSRWRIRSDLYRWLPDGDWQRATRAARRVEPRGGGGKLLAPRLVPGGTHLDEACCDTVGVTWGEAVPSPDGAWVAATRHRAGHWSLVRWPSAAPDSLTSLVDGAGTLSDPVWRGDTLLFVSDWTGLPQVYWLIPGAPLRRISDAPFGARAPAALRSGALLYATLAADGWELHRAAPVVRDAPPVPAPPPFDSAPPVSVRETGLSLWPSLRPRFWLPLFVDEADAGRFVGALTAGSDALGRYVYVADLFVAPSPLRAQGGIAVLSNAFGNPTFDLSGSRQWSLVGVTRAGTVVSERVDDGALGMTFERRRWRSFARLRLAAEYKGDHFAAAPAVPLASVCIGCSGRDQVGGSATLSLGHLVGASLAISPDHGLEVTGLARRREQQGSPRWYNEALGRLRWYTRVPGPSGYAHSVLALRAAVGARNGPLAETFGVGGVSSGVLSLGLNASFGSSRFFPVRGYAGSTVVGRRAATVSLEYRVPLALIGQSFGHLPFGADRMALALFADGGDAWEPGQPARFHRLRSVGAELVSDLTFSYDFPLRLRFGLAEPLATPPTPGGGARRPQAYAALAADF